MDTKLDKICSITSAQQWRRPLINLRGGIKGAGHLSPSVIPPFPALPSRGLSRRGSAQSLITCFQTFRCNLYSSQTAL